MPSKRVTGKAMPPAHWPVAGPSLPALSSCRSTKRWTVVIGSPSTTVRNLTTAEAADLVLEVAKQNSLLVKGVARLSIEAREEK